MVTGTPQQADGPAPDRPAPAPGGHPDGAGQPVLDGQPVPGRPVAGQRSAGQPGAPAGQLAARRLPPVTQCLVAALILVIAGGIDLAARLPARASLGVPVAALAAAGVALLAAVVLLSRVREFAWHTFRVVGICTLGAYAVIAGMLEFVFVLDHTPGSLLTVLSLMLLVFALDIPLLLAFSVARYQPAPGRPANPPQPPQ